MKRFANLTIRTRLLLALLPLGLTVIAAVFFSSREMERIDARYNDLLDHKVKAIMALIRSNHRATLINQVLYELIAENDPDTRSRTEAEIDKNIREYHAFLDIAKQHSPQDISRIDEIARQFEAFAVEANVVRDKARTQNGAESLEIARGRARPLFLYARASANTLADGMRASLDEATEAAQRDTDNTIRLTWLTISVGLALSLALAVFISQAGVARPLLRLRDAIGDVAAGRLDGEAPYQDLTNEVGQIAKALGVLRQGAIERDIQSYARAEAALAGEGLQTAGEYRDFAEVLFSRLAAGLDLVHGGLFLVQAETRRLALVGGFALDDPETPVSLAMGEGLPGQCALDGRPIELALTDNDVGVTVKTGLGAIIPRHLLFLPLCGKAGIIAVLELACATPPGERERSLLDALLPVAALNLEILSGNLATRRLLEKTRLQAESLAVSEAQLIARKDELQSVLGEVEDVKAQMEEMTGSLPVGVFQVVYAPDGTGRFAFVSDQVEAVIGVGPDDLRADAANAWRHVLPEDVESGRRHIASALSRAFSGEAVSRGEMVLRLTIEGRERFALTNAHYAPMPDGTVAANGFFQDVTERMLAEKALAESKQVLQGIFDTSPVGVAFSTEGVIRFANPTFVALFGAGVGDSVADRYVHPEERRRIGEELGLTGIVADTDVQMYGADKSVRDIQATYNRMEFDGTPSVLGWFMDVTERKKAEGLKVDRDVAIAAARRAEEAQIALQEKMAEIERFNRLATGREQRIIELKTLLNDQAARAGQAPPFPSLEEREPREADAPVEAGEDLGAEVPIGELLDMESVKTLLDNFCNAVGVASAIIDLEGEILVAARWQRACTDFHRASAVSCARCVQSDTELAAKLQEGREFTMYRCANGMTDAASPIVIDGRHLANVFIGQFHLDTPDMDFFRRQAAECGFDEAAYLAAVRAAPVLDEAALPDILGFLTGFAKLTASLSMERRRSVTAEAATQRRAEELRLGRMEALSLAEDAEQARIEIARYRDHLEQLVAERTSELRASEKASRLAQAEMAQIFNTAAGGMRVIGLDLTVRKVNDAFLELTGYAREELEGHKCREVFGGTSCDNEECTVKRLLAGERRIALTLKRVRKDGVEIYCDLTATPLLSPEGELLGIIEDFRDVTDRHRAARAMEDAKRLAEEANKAKSDFLARMSHEIRTPMNAVIGMSHLALQTELTAKQHDYISKIQASANNLLGIINDILDFSKIEAGKMDIEEVAFDLDETLDNAASVISVKAEEKGLEVIFDIARDVPRNLVGDPLRLTQVLINYANNAIKFTEKGHIVLSARLLETRDDGRALIRFAVTDTGVGLSDEQIGRLFQSFSQADGSTTRKYGGTGLGLAICKRLATLMGGEVGVTSQPGQGSAFWFTALMGLGGEEQPLAAYVPAVDLRDMRCLVADDNPEMRRILAETLESFSFRVAVAADGAEALDILAGAVGDDPFRLVLLDWKMPGLRGNEVAKRIKNDPALNVTQILMVTAYGREDIMREAEESGVSAFLVKPVGASTLFDTIMEVFGQQVDRKVRGAKKSAVDKAALEGVKGASVLLVEDNEINQQVATELLRQAGLSVSIAGNGREAVEAVASGRFEAVLMDIQMPEMDGLEATRRIRLLDQPGMADLPIIAMTAHALSDDREKSLAAGMNDHVTKPIDPEELFGSLLRWIKPGRRDPAIPEARADFTPAEDDLPLAGLPGLSVKLGLSRMGGNRKLYRQLTAKFAAGNRDAAEAIRQSLAADDAKTAARLAHTMKSVAGNIGAEELSRQSGELERAIKAGETEAALGLLSDFADLLAQVLASIDRLAPAEAPAPAAPDRPAMDPGTLRRIVAELRELLDSDMGQALTRAEELNAHDLPPGLGPDLKRLGEALDDFDTEEAMAILDRLSAALESL